MLKSISFQNIFKTQIQALVTFIWQNMVHYIVLMMRYNNEIITERDAFSLHYASAAATYNNT